MYNVFAPGKGLGSCELVYAAERWQRDEGQLGGESSDAIITGIQLAAVACEHEFQS
jgi:hypothetical protein